MQSSNFSANITMCKIERVFSYNNVPMLTLSINYPKIVLRHNPTNQTKINCQIQEQINTFCRHASNDLYQQAIDGYKFAIENGFPFNAYDAVLNYEITYNQNCHLSFYRDQYEYTGGAHGNTIRYSDNWNLTNGCIIPLSRLFPAGQDYRTFLIEQIIQQADEQMQQNPGIYFEDYQNLIEQSFNEESFYLTPSGVAFYYQQYEIAPYATGIVVFTIPYETLQWYPSC